MILDICIYLPEYDFVYIISNALWALSKCTYITDRANHYHNNNVYI